MICDVCRDVIEAHVPKGVWSEEHRRDYYTPIWAHHLTCSSLKASVDKGCYICNRIWITLALEQQTYITGLAEQTQAAGVDELKLDNDEAPSSHTDFHTDIWKALKAVAHMKLSWHPDHQVEKLEIVGAFINIQQTYPPNMRPFDWNNSGIFLLQPYKDGDEAKIWPLDETTSSREALPLARNWCEQCVQGHTRCSASAPDITWYPTRLVDFRSPESPWSHFRLIHPRKEQVTGPYMTLSHCWGQADCLKLTTHNLAEMVGWLQVTLLPQLFQDAGYVARQLGVRYLWIDSLCIIQDGDKMADWRHESTLMDKVYAEAFCNISASTSPDPHHSLFNDRRTEVYTWQEVQLKRDGPTSVYHIVDQTTWSTDVVSALVNTRAWVLQERLLSRRILHFGERQILWECREKTAAEFYPEDLPWDHDRFLDASPRHLWYFNGQSLPLSESDPRYLDAIRIWPRIVNIYTRGQLSFPVDRMVALSAIAKIMAQILGDKYVAGMWHRSLKHQILWFVGDPVQISACQDSSYRAPSWSWAAADGPVCLPMWQMSDEEFFIEIKSYHLDYVTEEVTGLIEGGWIRLWGALKPLRLRREQESSELHEHYWEATINATKNQEVPGIVDGLHLDTFHRDFELQNANSSLYCIPCLKRRNYGFMILLLEVQDRSGGIFRRIGMITGLDLKDEDQILGPCDDEHQFPCEEYRDGKHLIQII